jgi:integrase
MTRHARSSRLEKRATRLKLPVAKKPYDFTPIGSGISLGYRRNQGAGTWVVRVADGRGGHWTKAIAAADDLEDANGGTVLDFWAAQERARTLTRGARSTDSDTGELLTVAQAADRYEADLRTRGGGLENVARIRRHVPPALASKTVALLTRRDMRHWRDGLIRKRLKPSSINRTTGSLKAALNLAAVQDERITNRAVWETGIPSIPDAQESRNVILAEPVVRDIITHAYEVGGEAFGLFTETAAISGARPSQLARLEIQDLQDGRPDPRLMMPSSRKGRGVKKIARTPVPITKSLAIKLRHAATGRADDARLLVRANGRPYMRSGHTDRFKRAVDRTGITGVSIYALRHSNIVRQILAGVPMRVVAVLHDTSVGMLERTYSRHIAGHADGVARHALLDLGAPAAGNVVPISGRG